MNSEELKHYGIKGQKWGVRRFQNKDGSYTAAGKKRRREDGGEYDEDRERLEKEVAKRKGEKYVRKTKKERAAEDAEAEKKAKELYYKEEAAYTRTESRMKPITEKLSKKYKIDSVNPDAVDSDDMDRLNKYFEEYDNEWFKILKEERAKEGLSHADLSTFELYHYGILGQKWGKRRYQNKDGSLTPEGKKRYGNVDNFNEQYPKDAKKAQVDAIKTTSATTEALKPGVKEYDKMAKDKRSKKQKEVDAAVEAEIRDRVYKMSDEDLRNAVNRINMEERYTQVMQQREHIELGRSKTEKFMSAATTTLRVAELAVPVALAIYGVKNGK